MHSSSKSAKLSRDCQDLGNEKCVMTWCPLLVLAGLIVVAGPLKQPTFDLQFPSAVEKANFFAASSMNATDWPHMHGRLETVIYLHSLTTDLLGAATLPASQLSLTRPPYQQSELLYLSWTLSAAARLTTTLTIAPDDLFVYHACSSRAAKCILQQGLLEEKAQPSGDLNTVFYTTTFLEQAMQRAAMLRKNDSDEPAHVMIFRISHANASQQGLWVEADNSEALAKFCRHHKRLPGFFHEQDAPCIILTTLCARPSTLQERTQPVPYKFQSLTAGQRDGINVGIRGQNYQTILAKSMVAVLTITLHNTVELQQVVSSADPYA